MVHPLLLRVATFNIRNGLAPDGFDAWPFRRRATAEMIRFLDCDVVGLQEVYRFQLRWLNRQLPDYEAVSTGRSAGDRGERCPVLWRRWSFRVSGWHTRWYGAEPELPGERLPGASFPRIATLCRLESLATGAQFQLVNTHLDDRSASGRLASVEQLVTWLDPQMPTVVVGDLNAEPDGKEVDVLRDAGLVDALPLHGYGTSHRFTGGTDRARIDYVLASRHWSVVDARVVVETPTGRLPSDHWPVVADLRLHDDEGSRPGRTRFAG